MLRKHEVIGELPNRNEMIRTTLQIGWPAMTESLLISLVSIVNTIMVGVIGTEAIAAVGLTTQPKFLVLAIFMALNVGTTAVVSRRRGEDRRESCNCALRQSIMLSTIGSVILGAVAFAFARPILVVAGGQADTIDYATTYFRIVIAGIFFLVLTNVINAAQRGVGNTKIAMRTNLIANLINVVLGYLLIGGHLGFPRLGVAGAAIASVVGSIVAFSIALWSVRKKDAYLYLSFKDFFKLDPENTRSITAVGGSAAVEQICMRIGFSLYAIFVANLGTLAFATHQIVMSVTNLSFSCGDGLSSAASALVGINLGKKRPDLAILYGKMCQRLGMLFAAVLLVFIGFGGRFLVSLFSTDPYVLATGANILWLCAFGMPMQISQVVYAGCLRGAGDTRFVAFMSFVCITILRPILAYVMCYPWGWGVYGAWTSYIVDQAARLGLVAWRYQTGKWTRIKL